MTALGALAPIVCPECDCRVGASAALVACECGGAGMACPRCAGTGVRTAGTRDTADEDAFAAPCPTHAPDEYRMWLARGRPRREAIAPEPSVGLLSHPIGGARPATGRRSGSARPGRACVAFLTNDREAWAWVDGTLGAAGYRVLADDASRARITELEIQPPDVLLIDLDRAEPDGLTLLRLVASAIPDVPVIVASARADIEGEEIRRAVHTAGALIFLEKPWAPGPLVASVDVSLEVTTRTLALASPYI